MQQNIGYSNAMIEILHKRNSYLAWYTHITAPKDSYGVFIVNISETIDSILLAPWHMY